VSTDISGLLAVCDRRSKLILKLAVRHKPLGHGN